MIDNITDKALKVYHVVYTDDKITKPDIFYYVYGVLHSPEYREKYEAFLIRDLPRVPFAPDFWAFCRAGEKLSKLHLYWESCDRYDLGEPLVPIPDKPDRIAFGDHGKDPTIFLVNNTMVYENLRLVRYKVNGHTPHGWMTIKLKKHPYIDRYPFRHMTGEQVREMLEKLLTVGLESDRIIGGLPAEFEMDVDVREYQTAPETLDRHMGRKTVD